MQERLKGKLNRRGEYRVPVNKRAICNALVSDSLFFSSCHDWGKCFACSLNVKSTHALFLRGGSLDSLEAQPRENAAVLLECLQFVPSSRKCTEFHLCLQDIWKGKVWTEKDGEKEETNEYKISHFMYEWTMCLRYGTTKRRVRRAATMMNPIM